MVQQRTPILANTCSSKADRDAAPPQARGFLVGQHGTWIVMGYAIAGWVGAGTYYSSNLSFQWRFPIALSIVPPLALAICAPWIPESPRWRT